MKKLNTVYLIRHGQVVGYERLHLNGHTDVDVTDVGILQMENLAERLRLVDIKAIYSSDLRRSVLGARIIGRYHDVPRCVMPELREMYFGDWEGLSLEEIRERFPGELEKRKENLVNYRIPGDGETISQLSERILSCFRRILEDQRGHSIVLVAHGAVNRVILCDALGLDLSQIFNFKQDYGCLNIIDYFNDSTLVRLMNG